MWKVPLYKGLYFMWKVPLYKGLYLCGRCLYIMGYIFEEKKDLSEFCACIIMCMYREELLLKIFLLKSSKMEALVRTRYC